ncbi:MAG: hypothetical protein QNJ90_03545 [Planctomycetota bacterium]|nr:hypothetical protein [Planctomycetota bacterium]
MGTFHSHKGELHGITVVVDLIDDRVYVGRCDTVLPEGVVLLDADVHDASESKYDGTKMSKEDYLANAVKFGVWPRIERIVVPAEDVASVTKLGDHA